MAISLFIGIRCANNDDPKSAYDSQRILECHNNQTLGLEETRDKIIGQWEWKHAEYIYAVPLDNDFKGMKIEFREDLTGTLTNNKVAPLDFTWSIGTYNIYFNFSTTPMVPQLNGQILFCDNIMLCGIAGSGITDGVNNYFQKIQ
ncbi:MAG: hypothetical protein ABI663_22475 [Chryseolinea sp.]